MNRLIKLNNLILFVVLTTGCANISKFSIDSIELDVPEEWNTKIPYNDALTGEWWKQFKDENLEKFIIEFQKNSPDLKSIAKNRLAIRAQK